MLVTLVCLVVGAGWCLAVWGQVPQDKNGRTDR